MSTDFYFWNKTKNEHVYAYGNHNRSDTLRCRWPTLFTWLMMNSWVECEVVCVPDSSDISFLETSKDVTNEAIYKWNTSFDNEHNVCEYGKYEYNQYAPGAENNETFEYKTEDERLDNGLCPKCENMLTDANEFDKTPMCHECGFRDYVYY